MARADEALLQVIQLSLQVVAVGLHAAATQQGRGVSRGDSGEWRQSLAG